MVEGGVGGYKECRRGMGGSVVAAEEESDVADCEQRVSTWQSTWDGMLLDSWPALVGAQASHAVAGFCIFWSPVWVACVFWRTFWEEIG